MKKINIGLFIDTFYPMIDGVILVVDNYAKRLSKYANVFVFAPRIPHKRYDDSVFNYKVIRCRSMDVSFVDYSLPLPDFDIKFKKELEKCDLDIVHIHSPATLGRIGVNYAIRHNIPVVATMHSQYKQDFMRVTKSKYISNKLTNSIIKLFEKCDECWTMNNEIARIFQEDYGYKKQLKIINNATDMEFSKEKEKTDKELNKLYGIKKDEFVLLFVGRINKLKNIDLIINSLRKVKSKYKMLFVGSGQDEDYLKNKINKYNLSDRVIMCGRVKDREELTAYYARADLFLFPSFYDSNSLVQLEAASQKTPTLFVKGSATAAKVIDDVNGFIANNNPDSYANKIDEILSNGGFLKEVGENAYNDLYVRWDDEVQKIYESYLRIIESRDK